MFHYAASQVDERSYMPCWNRWTRCVWNSIGPTRRDLAETEFYPSRLVITTGPFKVDNHILADLASFTRIVTESYTLSWYVRSFESSPSKSRPIHCRQVPGRLPAGFLWPPSLAIDGHGWNELPTIAAAAARHCHGGDPGCIPWHFDCIWYELKLYN